MLLKGLFTILTFLFLGSILPANGQNIYTALNHDRKEDIVNKRVLEVITEKVFYNSTGKTKEKSVKRLNHHNLVLVEERYDQNGKIQARLTLDYDSSGQYSISRKFERWNNGRYSSETAFYEYDENWHLISVTDKNAQGNVFQQTRLKNNQNGHPVQLQLLDGNGKSYGIELAQYDYDKNLAYTEVRSNNGATLSRDTLTIDLNLNTNLSTEVALKDQDNVETDNGYQNEYLYDQFGNWTRLTIYKIENGKKKTDRVFKRKIKYQE